jgi:hypothetical protein
VAAIKMSPESGRIIWQYSPRHYAPKGHKKLSA